MTLNNDFANFSDFDKAESDKASKYWDKIMAMDNPLNKGEAISREEELDIISRAPKGKSGLRIVKSKGRTCHCQHGSDQHAWKKRNGDWFTSVRCKVKGCECNKFCSQHAWDNLK